MMSRMMTYSFCMNEAEAGHIADACEEAEIMLSRAAGVFELFHNLIAGGHVDGQDPGFVATLELVGIGLRRQADTIGAKCGVAGTAIRHAKKEETAA